MERISRTLGMILFVIVVHSSVVFAQAVSMHAAETASRAFLRQKAEQGSSVGKAAAANVTRVRELRAPDSDATVGFVAELAPVGYVLIGPDERIEPVISYSLTHDFPWSESGHFLVRVASADLAARVAAIDRIPETAANLAKQKWERYRSGSIQRFKPAVFRQWPTEGSTLTEGWIETTWGQLEPYNEFCPRDLADDGSPRSWTGCMATAVAQIINYHRHWGNFTLDGDDRYVTMTRGISIDADSTSADFPSFSVLNDYIKSIGQTFQSGGQLNDSQLAALFFTIGVLGEMDYSYSFGSGAHDFIFWDNLEKKGVVYNREFMSSLNPDFYAQLKTSIMQGFPATLLINKSTICSPNHLVICDGYNTDGFYHLNFGWGDSTPDPINAAWYSLPEGMGDGYDVIWDGNMNLRPQTTSVTLLATDVRSVDLGGGPVNGYSPVRTVRLTNNSLNTITVQSIEPSDPAFQVGLSEMQFASTLGAFDIVAGQAREFFVRCRPDKIGTFTGDVLIEYQEDSPVFTVIDLVCLGVPEGGTIVNAGEVSGTWTRAQSPYHVCGDIQVYGDFTIEPGVTVIFRGKYGMEVGVAAKFRAVGTLSDSITFMPSDPAVGWYGIDLYGDGAMETPQGEHVMEYCIVTGGRADGPHPQNCGGGISMSSSTALIRNCLIQNNIASGSGNGIFIGGQFGDMKTVRGPRIVNTVISSNSGSSMGGGIMVSRTKNVVLENVTIAGNSGNYGGGITVNGESTVHLTNCIMWGNISGGGLEVCLGMDPHGETVSDSLFFSYCDIDTLRADWFKQGAIPGVIVWGEGNIAADPCFDSTGPMQYILLPDSPCIDAGSPDPGYNDAEDPLNTGMAQRPAGGTTRNDIGAFGGGGDKPVRADESIPAIFMVNGPYPNPFNPSTVIEYTIPENGRVNLVIYDTLGRRVAVLQDGYLDRGTHRHTWNGMDENSRPVGSGVYLFRLRAGARTAGGKMLLLR